LLLTFNIFCEAHASHAAQPVIMCGLFRWESEKPHQHAQQDQRADEREQCVKRVEMEIRVSRETMAGYQMPCCQHKTSLAHAAGANGCPVFSYCARVLVIRALIFTLLWYTIAMPEKIALITGASSGMPKMQLALQRILPWKWHEKVIANFLKIDQSLKHARHRGARRMACRSPFEVFQ
jgi:hypothetical protein